MAVMMQESAGTGCDPMGASLSSFNEEFPREEAGTSCESGITDPQYSIKIGILHLRETMSRADVDGATDLDGIEYALQGYDMGFGWFDETTSPWTQEKAEAYSAMMQEELGVDSFGDPQYPKHVMRYYSYGGRGQLQSMPDFTNRTHGGMTIHILGQSSMGSVHGLPGEDSMKSMDGHHPGLQTDVPGSAI